MEEIFMINQLMIKLKSMMKLLSMYERVWWKIATGQGDDHTTGCLLDYLYFKGHYQLIAVDLRK